MKVLKFKNISEVVSALKDSSGKTFMVKPGEVVEIRAKKATDIRYSKLSFSLIGDEKEILKKNLKENIEKETKETKEVMSSTNSTEKKIVKSKSKTDKFNGNKEIKEKEEKDNVLKFDGNKEPIKEEKDSTSKFDGE